MYRFNEATEITNIQQNNQNYGIQQRNSAKAKMVYNIQEISQT
jgi:hypothetical protein